MVRLEGHIITISQCHKHMATSVIPKSLASDLNVLSSRFIKSSTTDATQTFNLSNMRKTFTEPIFLFAAGFSTIYISALIFMNQVTENNVSYTVLASNNRSIQSATYDPDTSILTITLNASMYRRGGLLLLQ